MPRATPKNFLDDVASVNLYGAGTYGYHQFLLEAIARLVIEYQAAFPEADLATELRKQVKEWKQRG